MTPVRVLIVSGIWPPDIGGPASHGPGLGRYLADRGHRVTAVASVSTAPADPGFTLIPTSRDRVLAMRWADAELKIAAMARAADIIYATGLYHRSAVAGLIARVPVVLKLVNDPAYERARNSGLFAGTLEEFQSSSASRGIALLKRLRGAMLARARGIIVPSSYLAEIVRGWGVPDAKITVIPNPAPAEPERTPREELRRALGLEGPSIVFAGRFVLQKNLPMVIEAVRKLEGVTLWLVGDGPERSRVVEEIAARDLGDRVRICPSVPRREALRWMRAADVTVLPSSWENYPHAAVESLTVGTPVVATSVGGVPEIVEHGTSGLLVAPNDAEGLAAALRQALYEPRVGELLRLGAEAVGDRFHPTRMFSAAERVIVSEAKTRKPT